MSGIEVVGIVLGALPLLVEGLRAYNSGRKTIAVAIHKRVLVDSLCRTLQGAAVTLEELLKKILLQSGCELPSQLSEEIGSILSTSEVQADLATYLDKSFEILVSEVAKCYDILHALSAKVASFVPVQTSNALIAILNANRQLPKSEISLVSRMKFAFGLKDLEKDCRELSDRIEKMERLVRLVSDNQELSGFQPSRKAKRMARTLQRIRKHAADLHTAVSNGWELDCHQRHEAKLRLRDRLDDIKQTRPKVSSHQQPLHIFELVFVGEASLPLWHEAAVHVFGDSDDECDDESIVAAPARTVPHIRVNVVEPAVTKAHNKANQIDGICSVIQQAEAIQQQPVFILSSRCRLCQSTKFQRRSTTCESSATMLLSVLLRNGKDITGKKLSLSFKWGERLRLALTVASTFLQLFQTPWTAPKFSSETISFLINPQNPLNFSDPYLSVSFWGTPARIYSAANSYNAVREAFLDLGIMLLEIWHATTMKQQLCLDEEPTGSKRELYAIEWLDKEHGNMPGRYEDAVAHCISGIRCMGLSRLAWSDMKIWESVCEHVIEPLGVLANA